MLRIPTIEEIRAARAALDPFIVRTPVVPWKGDSARRLFGAGTEVTLKLESFQKTGTFKTRGALTVMMNLPKDQLKRGVTAVSAGNHAIAVAYAAKVLGVPAKIAMKEGANQYRIDKVRALGAEIKFCRNFHVAFEEAEHLQKDEGLTFVHPFEGPYTWLGTATCGLEFAEQAPDLDAAIIAIGGGGLISGVSTALKLMNPKIKIFGVEPFGACTMWMSMQSGKPETIPSIDTIADSLGAPMSLPGGVEHCLRNLEDIVRLEDEAMIEAMRILYDEFKLALEPAAAAATAALTGPLKETLKGKKVGILICGSNISIEDFSNLVR